MKQISNEQVQALLNTIYQTNITAQTFDAVKNLLMGLPEVSPETAGTDLPAVEEAKPEAPVEA